MNPVNPATHSRNLDECIAAATADCQSVLEFGCMFGDRLMATSCPIKIGVDVHQPYLDRAVQRHGSEAVFLQGDARQAALWFLPRSIDAVLLIDFLEHLAELDANRILERCQTVARKRIIAFVPEGNHPQDRDVTDLGGDHWQTHRSVWYRDDLAKHDFDVVVWDDFHNIPGKDRGAMFAIWEPRSHARSHGRE
jgi:hypothetical protein